MHSFAPSTILILPHHLHAPPPLQYMTRFTAWLGSYSTSNKQRRLLAELATNLAASGHVHAGRADVRLLYVPVFKELLTRPLVDEGEAGVQAAIAIMRVRRGGGGCAGGWGADGEREEGWARSHSMQHLI
jgi:hypothetical protein